MGKLIIVVLGSLLLSSCAYGPLTPAQERYIAWRDYCSKNPTPQPCLDAMSPAGFGQGAATGHGGHGGHGK